MIDIICLLCHKYPTLPLIEDKNEMNALEYAILSEMDFGVIGTLLEMTKKAQFFEIKKNRSKSPSSGNGSYGLRLLETVAE